MLRSFDLIKLLVVHGASVNGRDARGRPALMLAVQCGQSAIVTLLLTYGGDAWIKDSAGLSAIDYAGQLSNKNILHALVAYAQPYKSAGH